MSLILFSFFSCKEDLMNERKNKPSLFDMHNNLNELYYEDEDGQSAQYHMPLASVDELDRFGTEIDNNEGFVPYRFARQYAFIEFMASARAFLPHYVYDAVMCSILAGTEIPIAITNRPAIVYNYDDTPYYYEFGVIMGEQLLTVITVYAHKMSDQLIAFVGAPSYGPLDFQYKRYVGQYPRVYYSDWGMPLSVPELIDEYTNQYELMPVNESCEPIYTNPLDILNDKLSNIPFEDINVMNEDLTMAEPLETEDGYVPMASSIGNLISNCTNIYNTSMSVLNERFAELAKEDIDTAFTLSEEQKKIISNIISEEQTYTYYIPEYENDQLRFTHWIGYCGPAAMAWLYRGKWENFRGEYIPIYGDGEILSDNIRFYYGGSGSYGYYNTSSSTCARYGDIADQYSWICMSMEYDNGLCGAWYEYCHSLCGGQALFAGGLRDGLEWASTDAGEAYITRFTVIPLSWICDKQEPICRRKSCTVL